MRKWIGLALAMCMTILSAGCGNTAQAERDSGQETSENGNDNITAIELSDKEEKIDDDFSAIRFQGDDGFEGFLSQGGASSDGQVIEYLAGNLFAEASELQFADGAFGCSTIETTNPNGEALFGRNFDWENCEAYVVAAHPENGYSSISTVNIDFITQGLGAASVAMLSSDVKTMAALYAPLDGMNDQGLCVSVNMIDDGNTIEQNTDNPDITTTTAIRLLLNKAANVEEAITLLESYDMHSSMGMMIHFAIGDREGNSVVVEYIDNEMVVTETPVVTNFYLAEGDSQGVGSSQSHERYEILMKALEETPNMTLEQVRDALDSVSKDNFEEFLSTEWSVVYNQSAGTATYYHRENYGEGYMISLSNQ